MPIAFSYEEIDRLTNSMSDMEIAFAYRLAYSAVRKARLYHGVQTFTQKTGLVRIAETGELRPKGSVRGVVREDDLEIDFFKVIDTPEKAYWLGALSADGWTTLRNKVPKETGLAVHPDDVEWLQQFQRSIGHEGKIVIKENRNSLARGGVSCIASLRVTCQEFTKHAINAGVIPRKSGRLQVPSIGEKLFQHYCRGLFDGDGSIGTVNFALICNSEEFAEQMQAKIESCTGNRLRLSSATSPTTGKPVARLTGYRKDKSVIGWIYQHPAPVMARKYEKFSMFWD